MSHENLRAYTIKYSYTIIRFITPNDIHNTQPIIVMNLIRMLIQAPEASIYCPPILPEPITCTIAHSKAVMTVHTLWDGVG